MTEGRDVHPDRQVVRGPPRLKRLQDPAAAGEEPRCEADPVERGEGTRGVEAAARSVQYERAFYGFETVARGPFIEVPGEDRIAPRGLEMPHEHRGLPPPVTAQEAQMHGRERDGPTCLRDPRHHRTARLEAGQVDPLPVDQVDPWRQEHGIAVPTQAVPAPGRHDTPAVPFEHRAGQGGGAVPEPEVGLLQGNDVGADPLHDPKDSRRIAPPVEPERLADVVGGDPQEPGSLRPMLRRRVIGAIWSGFMLLGGTALVLGRGELAVVACLAAILSAVPVLFAARLRIVLPLPFVLALAAFLTASLIAGEAFDAYERLWWWDLVLHGTSATGMGMAGTLYVLMLFQGDRYAAPPWAQAGIAACLAIAAGTVWELFEFGMDQAFGLSMQKSGLPDTMGDLAVNALGALIGGASGALYLAGRGRGLGARLIAQFVRLNGRHFGRLRRGRGPR